MTVQEEEALIVRQMYPYHGKHTLLCFTFKEDIRSFVPMLKFKRKGRQYFFDVSIILYFTLRYNKNFLIHFLDSITDRIYIYVHHVGQFLQIAIRNSLTELISMDGTTYLNVELLVSQSLSTSSQPCNENASVYDKCVFDEYLAKLSRTNSCLLPFLPQHFAPEISHCNNFSLAIKSLKQFQNRSSTCIASCQLVITDLSIQLEDQYLSIA
jgi:hypothetical protein